MLAATLSAAPLVAGNTVPGTIAGHLEQGTRRVTLDNGMVLILREDQTLPMVSVQFWVGTGSSHEQEYLGAGLSHLIEHMIFKGTPTRGPAEITQAVNDVGGMINAYTSLDRTVFFTDLPAANWEVGLEVLADALRNAAFPEDEWQKEKEVIIREMAMYRDDPDSEVSRMLLETAYRIHPYRVPVIGYEDVFRRITRDDILAFFQRHYTPDNMILAIVGGIDIDRAESAARRLLEDFERRARPPQALPREPAQLGERIVRRYGPHQVGRLEQAWHAVSLEHPDAPALDVLAIVTGSGRSSRLAARIVEREKLAHSISAWSYLPAEPGLFGITAVFDPEREAQLRRAIDDEIARWHDTPFTEAETEKARRMVLTRTINDLQTVHGQARSLAGGELYAGTPFFTGIYLQRLEAVTPAVLNEVARRYLDTHRRSMALLLPEDPQAAAVAAEQPARIQPAVQKTALDNGLTLLTMENPRLPVVNICMVFNGGLRFENADNNGITSMMADLLTRGTQRRTAEQVAEIVENLGGTFTAFAGQNSFGLRMQCLPEDAATYMELLSDSLLNPAFSTAEIDKRRAIQKAAIAQQYESPVFLAQEELRRMLFPGHPYRFIPDGTPETLDALGASDLKHWHQRLAVTGNAVLAVFGDISADAARALAERHFRRMPRGVPPALEFSAPEPPTLPDVSERSAPKQQTIVIQGFPGLVINDPRTETLDLLQQMLSGLSSDLVINIRDKEGLAYFAGAINRPGLDPGMFAIYAGIDYPALARVKELIAEEIARVTGGGARTGEINRAREQLIARHLNRMQINGDLAMDCALNELYGLGYDYGFGREARLRAITPDDLAGAAAAVLHPGRSAIAVIAPERTAGEQ